MLVNINADIQDLKLSNIHNDIVLMLHIYWHCNHNYHDSGNYTGGKGRCDMHPEEKAGAELQDLQRLAAMYLDNEEKMHSRSFSF